MTTVQELIKTTPPGLDGTYSGSCITCLRGTDTALALKGPELDWYAAALHVLGMPLADAIATVEHYTPEPNEPMIIRICEGCVSASEPFAGLKPGHIDGDIPTIGRAR